MWLVHFVLCFLGVVHAVDLDKTFAKTKAKLGTKTIDIYIADTDAKRARGLMFVEKLPADTGMLFVFDQPQRLSFWMKNTLIPLAIGFLDDACVLREHAEMEVASSVFAEIPTSHSLGTMKYALEMNRGWYLGKNAVGAKLKLISPTTAPASVSACK